MSLEVIYPRFNYIVLVAFPIVLRRPRLHSMLCKNLVDIGKKGMCDTPYSIFF
jgi:hypothetical protein